MTLSVGARPSTEARHTDKEERIKTVTMSVDQGLTQRYQAPQHTDRYSPAKSRWALTILFTIMGISALGIIANETVSEPYPALFQPSFGGDGQHPDVAHVTRMDFFVTYDDGTTQQFDNKDVLYDSPILHTPIMAMGFGIHEGKGIMETAPSSITWGAQRIREISGDKSVKDARIDWTKSGYGLADGELQYSQVVRSLDLIRDGQDVTSS